MSDLRLAHRCAPECPSLGCNEVETVRLARLVAIIGEELARLNDGELPRDVPPDLVPILEFGHPPPEGIGHTCDKCGCQQLDRSKTCPDVPFPYLELAADVVRGCDHYKMAGGRPCYACIGLAIMRGEERGRHAREHG